jgi:hypothetical protein
MGMSGTHLAKYRYKLIPLKIKESIILRQNAHGVDFLWYELVVFSFEDSF